MIDARIALGVQPVQLPDPVNKLAQLMQLQNAQRQGQLGEMQLAEYGEKKARASGLRNLLSQQYDRPEAREDALLRGGFVEEASKLGTDRRANLKADTDTRKAQTELVDARLKQSRQFLTNVTTPEQYIAWHEGNHKDEVLGPMLAQRGITADSARSSITKALSEPGGFERLLQQSAMGIEKFMEMNAPKITTQNLGGTSRIVATPGLGGAPTVLSEAPITQSADSIASTATARRGQDMVNQRGMEANRLKEKEIGQMGGFLKLTEDQGKATGWLVQAENAYKNMMAAGADKAGNPTSASQPGFNDALAAIPSFGATAAIANSMRGADRQKFMQAASSLSESLLRAATGAGVNKEEAEQKIRELTPQFGEDAEVTRQKYAAIPLYIQSLRVRAGPGAGRAAAINGTSGAEGSWDNDPLGLFK